MSQEHWKIKFREKLGEFYNRIFFGDVNEKTQYNDIEEYVEFLFSKKRKEERNNTLKLILQEARLNSFLRDDLETNRRDVVCLEYEQLSNIIEKLKVCEEKK